jgi:glycosyltransferase involved in cell wall biosynthesis
MARIAFFSEKLPTESDAQNWAQDVRDPITAFSFGLITSLADQQHEVRVFSTYREGETPPAQHPRLQIIRPFRNWGWLEIPRLIPILLEFQPEIVHIVQPRAESLRGLTNALTALPAMAPVMGKPRFVLSLYDVSPQALNRNKTLLSFTDVIIVTNRHQADEITRWYNGEKTPLIEIVPLPTGETNEATNEIEPLPALDALEARCKKIVLVPGDLTNQRDPVKLVKILNETLSQIPELGVVFAGGWGNLSVLERRTLMREFEDRGHGARVLLTGPLSASQEQACLAAAQVVFLAALEQSSLALARWIRQSLQAARPLILRDEQCRLDPLNWQDRVNAYIVSTESESWGATLSEALLNGELRAQIQRKLPDFTRSEAVDQPGNAMSRIYAQVLRTPRSSLR